VVRAIRNFTSGSSGKRSKMHLLWFLLIGIVAGWLAGKIMSGGGFGLVGDLVIGVVGAFVGGFLLGILGFHAAGTIGTLITATLGAVVLLYLIRLIKRA
jgi:uncharacterized membrane protein YeaQ/YmgE (transglycosylase-associated protein family)